MRYFPMMFLLLLPAQVFAEPQEVQITSPHSGWQENNGDGANYSQEVNYPASSVNIAANQNAAARIRGQIKGLHKLPDKTAQPGRLIVNGIDMPQRIEEDGSFARPYIFSQGSNSIEVKSPDGQSSDKMQFYATKGSGTISARLRVVLSWDTDNTDLDLHVVTPDGGHALYGGKLLENGGALDIDVTTGYGPEMFSTPTPLKGRYLVYVNYYGGRSKTELTTAHITIITEEGSINEKQETFIVPMRNAGELTLVKSFSY